MRLDIRERYNVLGILPAQGKYQEMFRRKVMREMLTPTKEEENEIGLVRMAKGTPGEHVQWDDEKYDAKKGLEKEIRLDAEMCAMVSAELVKLNDEEKLTEHQVSLYEKFVMSSPKGEDGKEEGN